MSKITKVDTTKINLNYNKNKQGNKNQSNNNDNNIIKKINEYITTSMESYAIESLSKYYKLSEGIYDINNFDDEFGGNQGVFEEYFERYIKDEKVREIINKYYPNEELTEEDLYLLFSRMNYVGCGYVAICNSIYNNAMKKMSYKEFQDKFGFPPYDITTNEEKEFFKHYNYEYMYLECFLNYQKNCKNFKSIKEIYGNERENISQGDGALSDDDFELVGADGLSQFDDPIVAKSYLQSKKISCSCYGSTVYTPEKYNNLVKYGFLDPEDGITEKNIDAYKKALKDGKEIVVSCEGFDLHYVTTDRNGNLKAIDRILRKDVGGHGMSVVGVDEEKRKLIISTWGGCAAIDVNDVYNFMIYDFD